MLDNDLDRVILRRLDLTTTWRLVLYFLFQGCSSVLRQPSSSQA